MEDPDPISTTLMIGEEELLERNRDRTRSTQDTLAKYPRLMRGELRERECVKPECRGWRRVEKLSVEYFRSAMCALALAASKLERFAASEWERESGENALMIFLSLQL